MRPVGSRVSSVDTIPDKPVLPCAPSLPNTWAWSTWGNWHRTIWLCRKIAGVKSGILPLRERPFVVETLQPAPENLCLSLRAFERVGLVPVLVDPPLHGFGGGTNRPGPGLELNQVKTARPENEKIHFVARNRLAVGHEREIGPGPIRALVRKVFAYVLQPLTLMRKERRGDFNPAVAVRIHGLAPLPVT